MNIFKKRTYLDVLQAGLESAKLGVLQAKDAQSRAAAEVTYAEDRLQRLQGALEKEKASG